MPTPIRWQIPTKLTPAEQHVADKLHRIGKCYVFLREIRAQLFDEAFEAELAAAYQPRGVAPLPPALLAMVTLLQAYDHVGDAEAVVTAQVDQRWQLALGCLGASAAPFSQGALVKFRARMMAHHLDQKLLDRTVALAKQTGRFGWQALRAALDSSPLIGAGRVEDTWNLIGRALRTVATCAAKTLRVPRDQVLREAGVTLLLAEARVTCPAQQTASFVPGAATAHFAAALCQPCSLRAACTTARGGRSIAIHPQEALLQSLRTYQQQPEGRAHLRQRTTIEHSLARVDHQQGPKARYTGLRKSTLDVRRVAAVANLQRIARLPKVA